MAGRDRHPGCREEHDKQPGKGNQRLERAGFAGSHPQGSGARDRHGDPQGQAEMRAQAAPFPSPELQEPPSFVGCPDISFCKLESGVRHGA